MLSFLLGRLKGEESKRTKWSIIFLFEALVEKNTDLRPIFGEVTMNALRKSSCFVVRWPPSGGVN